MAFIATHRLYDAVIADCAHIKSFYGVLADTLVLSAVDTLKFLLLVVGKDTLGGIIL